MFKKTTCSKTLTIFHIYAIILRQNIPDKSLYKDKYNLSIQCIAQTANYGVETLKEELFSTLILA
jgi:hypothetical protein